MVLVAESFDHVVGIDTHSRSHTYAVVDAKTGAVSGPEKFPAHRAGLRRAISWIHRNTTNGAVIAGVEGTRSYGGYISTMLHTAQVEVVEVKPPRKATRAGVVLSVVDFVVDAVSVVADVEGMAMAAPGVLDGAIVGSVYVCSS